MHEYPVTEQIIKIASEKAKENNAIKVCHIALVVGEHSGFIGESIQMYFDIISRGTICEGAILEIENIKAKWKCPLCDITYMRQPYSFACPKCGQDGLPTNIGKEFYIKSIEVEVP
ncbi:MAG: hydrogenase maturation nickel metallochaperone HypA [Peptococcaceae bacterium]|mgnify:CR=1 FL=1|jgi:hydrogenase nickel incorporation protein HypA/HybF|nr:hydrogenase maturation nickel metallochaperone HypA [Peptococcaceae bacterium]